VIRCHTGHGRRCRGRVGHGTVIVTLVSQIAERQQGTRVHPFEVISG
jgi:hypothetical protein